MPENHVFCLYRGGKLSCELFESGVEAIKDIPEDIKLNDKQGIQRDCAITGKPHIHKESIKNFLKTLKYPLYYLDFETFSTAVPMFSGLKPYSQVCFQFSLHVVENQKSKPKHYEFLYEGNGDPRYDRRYGRAQRLTGIGQGCKGRHLDDCSQGSLQRA